MDNEVRDRERKLAILEEEGEIVSKEREIEEEKAAIRSAKKQYGRNWKKVLGVLKVDRETLHTLHGLGVDSSLRDYNDPRAWRR